MSLCRNVCLQWHDMVLIAGKFDFLKILTVFYRWTKEVTGCSPAVVFSIHVSRS